MDYTHPFDFSTDPNPLLLGNGCWVVPCVWINVPSLEKAMVSSPLQLAPFAIAPLAVPASAEASSALCGLPIPFAGPIYGQPDPQTEHAFGPPAAIPEINLSSLSADEQALLLNAPFPTVHNIGDDLLAGMTFQGKPTALKFICVLLNTSATC